ncbi:MAG: hypothetical protein ACI9F9_001141 [Candidatus Paceibacteria bacterium]|jgi:hypothetical protein
MEPQENLELDGPPPSPYNNLWMPLVVIPGVIVLVLVLIFMAFGGITGSEPSIQENLRIVTSGGKNERTQAVFNLSQKIVANGNARLAGEEEPWPVPEDLEAQVALAWDRTLPEEATTRTVLASLQAQLGSEDGVPHLIGLLSMGEMEDPGAELRFVVLVTLGTSGDPRAIPEVVKACQSEDSGLRSLAAILLQKVPSEDAIEPLKGMLADSKLEVRANSAISLAKHGDSSGAGVLSGLLGLEMYQAENANDPKRFRSANVVSQSRSKAAGALAILGRDEDRSVLEGYRDDPDMEFRGMILDRLANWGAE